MHAGEQSAPYDLPPPTATTSMQQTSCTLRFTEVAGQAFFFRCRIPPPASHIHGYQHHPVALTITNTNTLLQSHNHQHPLQSHNHQHLLQLHNWYAPLLHYSRAILVLVPTHHFVHAFCIDTNLSPPPFYPSPASPLAAGRGCDVSSPGRANLLEPAGRRQG